MVPGVAAPDGTMDPSTKVTTSPSDNKTTTITSSANGLPPSSGLLATITETWEEARDAVMETDIAISLIDKSEKLSKAAGKMWKVSKKVAWIVGTTAVVLILPLIYEIDKELAPIDGQIPPVGQPTQTSDSSASAQPDTAGGKTPAK